MVEMQWRRQVLILACKLCVHTNNGQRLAAMIFPVDIGLSLFYSEILPFNNVVTQSLLVETLVVSKNKYGRWKNRQRKHSMFDFKQRCEQLLQSLEGCTWKRLQLNLKLQEVALLWSIFTNLPIWYFSSSDHWPKSQWRHCPCPMAPRNI